MSIMGVCSFCTMHRGISPMRLKLRSPQAMPEGHQKHRTVPQAPAVALGGLDQLLDFALGEVFAWPMPTSPSRAFAICFSLPGVPTIRILSGIRTVIKA